MPAKPRPMPSRKKTVRRSRKLRKKVYDAVNKGYVPLQWPLPRACRLRMRYVDSYTITSTAGAISNQQYKINSCYDPDSTSVGHQPYGWDTLQTLFNAYCVKSVFIKVKMSACTTPMRVNFVPRYNSATIGTNYSLEEERPYSSNYMVGLEGKEVILKYDLAKLASKNWTWILQNQSNVLTADPGVLCYLNMYAKTADMVSSGTIAYDIEIVYDVYVNQAQFLAQS